MNLNKALLALAVGFLLAAASQGSDERQECAAPAATPTDGGEGS